MAASVVCAVADSPSAAEVLRVAVWMKEGLGLPLVIAHVVVVPAIVGLTSSSYLYTHPSDSELSREAGEALLEKIASRARDASGAELRVLIGDPAESLLRLAEEEQAQLIVVGSRGRGALITALLGSVSSTLTTQAPCPVVVVPPRATLEP